MNQAAKPALRPAIVILSISLAAYYICLSQNIGLYHDDWVVFVFDPLRFFDLFKGRPFMAIIELIFRVIGPYPQLLHLISGILFVSSGISLFQFMCRLFYFSNFTNCIFPAFIGVIIWSTLPWSIANNFWISNVPALLSVIGYTRTGTLMIDSWELKKTRERSLMLTVKITSWISLIFLSYEILIPSIILIPVFYFATPSNHKVRMKQWFHSTYCLFLAFAISCFMKTLMAGGGTSGKVLSNLFLQQFKHNLKIWISLRESLQSYYIPFTGLVLALTLVCIAKALIESTEFYVVFRSTLILVCISILGIILSAAITALFSYTYTGTGIFSRTLIGFSFWNTILISSAFAMILSGTSCSQLPPILFRYLAFAFATALVFLQLCAVGANVVSWNNVWLRELDVLRVINSKKLSISKKSTIILMNKVESSDGVAGFAAAWDFDAFVKYYIDPTAHGVILSQGNPLCISNRSIVQYADEEKVTVRLRIDSSDIDSIYTLLPAHGEFTALEYNSSVLCLPRQIATD